MLRSPWISLAGVLLLLTAAEAASDATGEASPSTRGSWGAPRALVRSTAYAFDPQLAVTEDGQAVAAWFGGTPPNTHHGERRFRAQVRWTGSTVVVDRGTVAGGFGPPVVLSPHGSAFPNALHVAVSGSGVTYVTWEQLEGPPMIAAAAPGGTFSTPHALLPTRNANLVGLFASPNGPVAAVWYTWTPSHKPGVTQYALLQADGRVGSLVTLGPSGGVSEMEWDAFALNDHGALAAVGRPSMGEEGDPKPHPVVPHPVVAVCDLAGRCSHPRSLELGRIAKGAFEQNAVALSDDGTVTVAAAYHTIPAHTGAATPLGLWAALRRPGGRWVTQKLASDGEWPLASADGQHGALAVFQTANPEGFMGGLAWSRLPARGDRFTRAAAVRGPNSPKPPVLAANLAGDSVLAWFSERPGLVNIAHSKLVAAVGEHGKIGRAKVLKTGDVALGTVRSGIDGVGDAIVIWSDSKTGPQGAERGGVFAVVHHR